MCGALLRNQRFGRSLSGCWCQAEAAKMPHGVWGLCPAFCNAGPSLETGRVDTAAQSNPFLCTLVSRDLLAP